MFAILNNENVCTLMSSTRDEYDNVIEVTENVLDKKYHDGKWIEPNSEEIQVTNNELKDIISNIEKTQLTLIQQAVEKSNKELRQEGADTAILELIKKGIL